MSETSTAHVLPGSFVLHLARLVSGHRGAEDELFRGLSICAEDLSDPAVTVPVDVAVSIAERARQLTGEPGIGVELGLQTYGPEHGYLGFAAMSAATLREAITMVCRYSPIRSTAFAFTLETRGARAAIVVAERADFGVARDIVMLSLLIGVWHATSVNLPPGARSETVIEVMFPEPGYYDRFRSHRPEVRFGCSANQIVFDTSLLDVKLATADPPSFRLARAECERMLQSISQQSRLVDQVARLALRAEGGSRSLQEVAELVDLSSRTLRRYLTQQGTSFATVRDEERHRRAKILLQSGMSIGKVAVHLGYATAGNFTRAFRHWTGQPPSRQYGSSSNARRPVLGRRP
jgi:AraC-like DNA-binding protein